MEKPTKTEKFVRDSAWKLYGNLMDMYRDLVDEYRRESKRRHGRIPYGEYPVTVEDKATNVGNSHSYYLSARHQTERTINKVLSLVSGHDCECSFDESNLTAHIDVDDGRKIRMRLSNHRPKNLPKMMVSVRCR